MRQRVVLAYSGGAGSTAAIPWLQDRHGVDVVAVVVGIGQRGELAGIRDGRWYAPARLALDAYVDTAEKTVTGSSTLALSAFACRVVGRRLERYDAQAASA